MPSSVPPAAPPPQYSRPPPYPGQQQQGGPPPPRGYPQNGPGQNTVIIRDRDDGGGFANGMLLGTGLGLMAGKCILRP